MQTNKQEMQANKQQLTQAKQAIARLQKEIEMIRQQPKEHIANSNNKAKKHNNKIDAAAWSDSLCNHYKRFKFDSNRIKQNGYGGGLIFGNRVLNTYYELTVRYDDVGKYGYFYLGIADASYKKNK